MTLQAEITALMTEAGWAPSVDRAGRVLPLIRKEGPFWIINGRPNGVDDHVGVAGPGAEFDRPDALAHALIERAKVTVRPETVFIPVLVAAPKEGVPVGNTLPDPETTAKLEAALEELEAVRAEMEGFRKLPEPGAPLLPDWVRDLMAAGETLAQARSRLTQVLNVEKAELRRERQVGEDSAELRKREADIDRQLGELAALGEAGGP